MRSNSLGQVLQRPMDERKPQIGMDQCLQLPQPKLTIYKSCCLTATLIRAYLAGMTSPKIRISGHFFFIDFSRPTFSTVRALVLNWLVFFSGCKHSAESVPVNLVVQEFHELCSSESASWMGEGRGVVPVSAQVVPV